MAERVIKVNGLYKKIARNLRSSMYQSAGDIASSMVANQAQNKFFWFFRKMRSYLTGAGRFFFEKYGFKTKKTFPSPADVGKSCQNKNH